MEKAGEKERDSPEGPSIGGVDDHEGDGGTEVDRLEDVEEIVQSLRQLSSAGLPRLCLYQFAELQFSGEIVVQVFPIPASHLIKDPSGLGEPSFADEESRGLHVEDQSVSDCDEGRE